MLILNGATDKLQVVTDSAADIEVTRSFTKVTSGTPSYDGAPLASITTATTTDVIAAPGSSNQIFVSGLGFFNNHGSSSCKVTVQRTDGTNTVNVAGGKALLLAGESLLCDAAGYWTHYDSNGAAYPAIGNAATQGDMETAAATDRFVTPAVVHYHPGVCKCWGKANGAGTSLIVNYNVSSITDTGTGRLTVNIGTDFSSADYAAVTSLQSVSTSLAVANVDNGGLLANTAVTAGTFEIWNYDDTATTHVAQDPLNYFWACFGDQ